MPGMPYRSDEPPTERLMLHVPSIPPGGKVEMDIPFHTGTRFKGEPPVTSLRFDEAALSIPEGQELQVKFPSVPSIFERALAITKNVVVIFTCLVLLYSIWEAHTIANAIGDAFSTFSNNFQDLGN